MLVPSILFNYFCLKSKPWCCEQSWNLVSYPCPGRKRQHIFTISLLFPFFFKNFLSLLSVFHVSGTRQSCWQQTALGVFSPGKSRQLAKCHLQRCVERMHCVTEISNPTLSHGFLCLCDAMGRFWSSEEVWLVWQQPVLPEPWEPSSEDLIPGLILMPNLASDFINGN